MNGRPRATGTCAVALALAGIASAAPPKEAEARPAVKPSTERTLRLPETPYRYAALDLPEHFRTPAARRFDNTPPDNPVTDAGLFKSPSLRNVEHTAPYMHDGRCANLAEVIDHYSRNVKPHPNVDGRVRRPLNFSDADKAALVAFLKTLSDKKFITDPKFSDPFK